MKDFPRDPTTDTALPDPQQQQQQLGEAPTMLPPFRFHFPRRSVSLGRGSSASRSAAAESAGRPKSTPESGVWLDRVVRDAEPPYTSSLAQRFNVDILLAGAAPVSVMLVYLGASIIRAIALFLTPVMMLSPLYPLYRARWGTGLKFASCGVYTSLIMMLNAFGIVSFPLYFVLEAVPQLVTTTFYFLVFSPGLMLAAVALTLMHRFTS